MATKPVKPRPVKSSLLQTKTASIKPKLTLADPLVGVPLHGPVTDRFEIQPSDITLITVGSIEVIIHPSSEEDETEPMEPPADQPIERPRDKP